MKKKRLKQMKSVKKRTVFAYLIQILKNKILKLFKTKSLIKKTKDFFFDCF